MRDPLSVIVKSHEAIEQMKADGRILTMTSHVPKIRVRDHKKLLNELMPYAVEWNIHKLDGNDFAYRFCQIFGKEFLEAWNEFHKIRDSLVEKPPKLTEEEKILRARQKTLEWRRAHPEASAQYYVKKTEKQRFAAENKKKKAQGGYLKPSSPSLPT